MTQLLLGTRKGLVVLEGEPDAGFEVAHRAFPGESVEYAMRDPRTGRYLAATTTWFYGPKLWVTDDPAGEWEQAPGVELPEGGDASLARMWVIEPGAADGVLYAGGDPGVLFESHDGGLSWELNAGLWEHETRPEWQPGGGGLCLHTIVPWPDDPARLMVAISAVGVWLTEDAGKSWHYSNSGIVADYMPEEAKGAPIGYCVHNVRRSPARPERLFMQFHGGVYRSDDAGGSWTNVGLDNGLPSDFGFPIVVDPADPDSAYVIPLDGAGDRVTPGGAVRVFQTRDGGASWTSSSEGLPQEHAWLTVLREAFDTRGSGAGLELYFGSTSGEVYGSGDAGTTWSRVAQSLPPVYSVRTA